MDAPVADEEDDDDDEEEEQADEEDDEENEKISLTKGSHRMHQSRS